jgi:hypothetical protein
MWLSTTDLKIFLKYRSSSKTHKTTEGTHTWQDLIRVSDCNCCLRSREGWVPRDGYLIVFGYLITLQIPKSMDVHVSYIKWCLFAYHNHTTSPIL